MIRIRKGYLVAAALVVVTLAGCNRYEAEVQVNGDGSGRRVVRFTMEPDSMETRTIGIERMRSIFGIDSGRGWSTGLRGDSAVFEKSGKEKVFEITEDAENAKDWGKMSGGITLRASDSDPELSRVVFKNEVSLEKSESDGATEWTYRERFVWDGLVDVIIDFQSGLFSDRVKAEYAGMSEETSSIIRGIYSGSLDLAISELKLWQDGGVEESRVAMSVGSRVASVMEDAGMEPDRMKIFETAKGVIEDTGGEFEGFIERNMPGVALAGLTEIRLNVSMPGKITDTNGEIGEDGTVRWKMSILDALNGPVEFFARSEGAGR